MTDIQRKYSNVDAAKWCKLVKFFSRAAAATCCINVVLVTDRRDRPVRRVLWVSRHVC